EPEPAIEPEPLLQRVTETEEVVARIEPKPSLLTAVPTLIPPRANVPKPVKQVSTPLPKNPKLRAVAHELDALPVEITFLAHRNPDSRTWESAVQQHLENATLSLESKDLAGAKLALRAARRYAVMGLNPVELSARAQILRDEAMHMLS